MNSFSHVIIRSLTRFERKTLMGVSGVGSALSLFILGAFFYVQTLAIEIATEISWLPVLAFLLYVTFFMVGYGSVCWLLVAELLPPTARPFLYPVAVASTWISNFAVGNLFWFMTRSIIGLHGALWFFAALTSAGIFFVVSCVPETRGQSAESISAFFRKHEKMLQEDENNFIVFDFDENERNDKFNI